MFFNQNQIKKTISLFTLTLTILGLVMPTISVNSQANLNSSTDRLEFMATSQDILVNPCEADSNEPKTKSWFVEKTKAGQTIEQCFKLQNISKEPKTFLVSSEDGIPNSAGSFAMTSQDKEKNGVGKWIELANTELIVEPESTLKENFKIKVPSDVEAGEYAGAIAIMEKPGEDKETFGNFKIQSRYGARIYVTVEGELNVGTEFKNFSFISPDSSVYNKFVKNAPSFAGEDVTMTWSFKETGNVFTILNGTLTVTDPDGQITTKKYGGEYFPKQTNTAEFNSLGIKWKTGNYKARYDFEHSVFIGSNKPENINDISPQNFVETEFVMNQETIDKMVEDKTKRNQEFAKSPSKAESTGEIKTPEENSEDKEVVAKTGGQTDNNMVLYGGIISGVTILLLLIVIALLLFKKKQTQKTVNVNTDFQKDENTSK
jgi:hypothetical protein